MKDDAQKDCMVLKRHNSLVAMAVNAADRYCIAMRSLQDAVQSDFSDAASYLESAATSVFYEFQAITKSIAALEKQFAHLTFNRSDLHQAADRAVTQNAATRASIQAALTRLASHLAQRRQVFGNAAVYSNELSSAKIIELRA